MALLEWAIDGNCADKSTAKYVERKIHCGFSGFGENKICDTSPMP